MKKITREELQLILEKHSLWLNNKEGGERADLSYTDLSGMDLSHINLTEAMLFDANLFDANLFGANLSDANLSDADLSYTDLSDANLSRANLFGANLSDANLSRAILRNTNLLYANLHDTNLYQADLFNTSTPQVEGIDIYSIDSIGTFDGKVTYIPKYNIVYAGCWKGTLDEFLVKGLEMNEDNATQQKNIELAYEFFKNNQ